MMKMKTGALLLLTAILSSCGYQDRSETTEADPAARINPWEQYLATPQYGDLVRTNGFVFIGREALEINICVDGTERCEGPFNVDGSPQPCWLKFKPSAEDDIKKLGIPGSLKDGRYWFKAQGRIAVRPGLFGHLNSYTCQVELERVTKISPE